jgi:glycosyltransferase involved in cell wall biosynthesis
MKLAFYYHITLHLQNHQLSLPGYLGVFIDSLAHEVEELYLVMHQANSNESKGADYVLKSNNIHWINLGLKTPVWHRDIFHRRFLKNSLAEIDNCDALIVRGPSPLAPYFHKFLSNQKLVFMVVGDYMESVEQWKLKSIREWVELQYLKYNDYLFRKAMRHTDIMVNSPVLFSKYKDIAKSIHQIRTTTLSSDDFFERIDTCQRELTELLFTGRIDPLKGLFELVEAVSILRKEGTNVRLNIVGWESDDDKPVEQELRLKIAKLGIVDFIIFHGRKSVGHELNKMYRMADIYVLPSHEEGFPRTIWEAMANGLPVITTDVGGIPAYLKHVENVYMIKPKDAVLIAGAIKAMITDQDLRQRLIKNGMEIARENTLEIQTKRIVDIVKSLKNE